MPTEVLANKINEKRLELGLTIDAIATEANMAESTVKNLCTAKTKNPGIETVLPVLKVLGISLDEVIYPDKSKKEVNDMSLLALKDIYEFQNAALKETHELNENNIRTHYERQIEEMTKSNEKVEKQYEKRLEAAQEQNDKLEKANKTKTIIIIVIAAIFIISFFGLLTMEIMHPEHGWLRY